MYHIKIVSTARVMMQSPLKLVRNDALVLWMSILKLLDIQTVGSILNQVVVFLLNYLEGMSPTLAL